MLLHVLALAAAALLAATAKADQLVNAKLHSSKNWGLCLGYGGGTDTLPAVLRPCSDPTTTLIIRDTAGATSIRFQNYCVNGGYMTVDGGQFVGNGGAADLQYCQDEARRATWDQWNDIHFSWRFTRVDGNRFRMYGFDQFAQAPCLDVKDGQFVNGQPIQIWDCHPDSHPDAPNQKWNIEFLGPV